tara:strand:- start:171 stop:473 length:303 start_codon:yes stop_codon:yes gene_type:complete
MFNDPRYNNMVNDISELLAKHDKEHYATILPEAVNETVNACADSIKQVPLGERTAEKLAEIMKEHFYGAARQHKLAVNHEMSSEFYRRVYDAMTKNTGSE